jgi:hypothetical protein
MHFTILRPQKKKEQPGAEAASEAACAIGAFTVFLWSKTRFENSDFSLAQI